MKFIFLILIFSVTVTQANDVILRGESLFRAASCALCHGTGTDRLSGGAGLTTAEGIFYPPNITPDKETGIGSWSNTDFLMAFRHGLAPVDGIAKKGEPYYPAFPYTSYTKMSDSDILAIKAYIFAKVKPVNKPNRKHKLKWMYRFRKLLYPWRKLFFKPGPMEPELGFERGSYIVQAVSHCTECHTPRYPLVKGLKVGLSFSGNADTPEGLAPNITCHAETGIGKWTVEDLVIYLEDGTRPFGGSAKGVMEKIIDSNTSYLSEADRWAIAEYLFSEPCLKRTDLNNEKGK